MAKKKYRSLPRGQVRIHGTHPNFGGSAYKLTVPSQIARMVGPDAVFQVELTEDGILYRYVEGAEKVELPRWLTGLSDS